MAFANAKCHIIAHCVLVYNSACTHECAMYARERATAFMLNVVFESGLSDRSGGCAQPIPLPPLQPGGSNRGGYLWTGLRDCLVVILVAEWVDRDVRWRGLW